MQYLKKNNIFSIRQNWEIVITVRCQSRCPCLKCRLCVQKYLQLIIVIKSASGVSDKIILLVKNNNFFAKISLVMTDHLFFIDVKNVYLSQERMGNLCFLVGVHCHI